MGAEDKPETGRRMPMRLPREIADQLWEAWPFGGAPWREIVGAGPFRVEELRDGDELVVRAELPGVDPEKDIDVTVEEDTLTITATRTQREEERNADGYRSEFRYGRLERRLRLPRGADGSAVRATYRDGVLEVRLPAPPPSQETRRITVERA